MTLHVVADRVDRDAELEHVVAAFVPVFGDEVEQRLAILDLGIGELRDVGGARVGLGRVGLALDEAGEQGVLDRLQPFLVRLGPFLEFLLGRP